MNEKSNGSPIQTFLLRMGIIVIFLAFFILFDFIPFDYPDTVKLFTFFVWLSIGVTEITVVYLLDKCKS